MREDSMVAPKVSILWVNYNSSAFIDLVLESLQKIKELDYPNYELIAVDNGSVDGSYEFVRKFAEGMRNAKIIRLKKNVGFTGGNNVAYKARDFRSKYVALLNNDAVPHPESLKKMVEIMEGNMQLGGCQGIVLDYNSNAIDNAGWLICELLGVYAVFNGKDPTVFKKPLYITYADGSYSIYRVDALKKAMHCAYKIFDDQMFAYYDDNILGLKIWNSGYKIASYPFIASRHRRSTSFKKIKTLQLYLNLRGRIVTNSISNSKFKLLAKASLLKGVLFNPFNIPKGKQLQSTLIKAYIDGKRISKIKKSYGEKIDLYKAPIITFNIFKAIPAAIIPRRYVMSIIKNALESAIAKFTF
jgi:GT2 family glycosyltransferase